MSGRAVVIILDSVGIGGAPDAGKFGDEGANTLGNIVNKCEKGEANSSRSGELNIPNMRALGLSEALFLSSGKKLSGISDVADPNSIFASAIEYSSGKDTPSGHLELAGLIVDWDWCYFPNQIPAFPKKQIELFLDDIGYPNIYGNCHASGTQILKDYGEQHLKTGFPIVYTSGDSVFQIAAHEDIIKICKLYEICESAAKIFHPLRVGRVIARPFKGQSANTFYRTANRRDFFMPVSKPTVLNSLDSHGVKIYSVGKISDIFSGIKFSGKVKGLSDKDLFFETCRLMDNLEDNSLIIANLIEFDSLFGHRRDVVGYAKALERFDSWLPRLVSSLKEDDMLLITADHGNDPTFPGSDHTREQVPVLVKIGSLAVRSTTKFGNKGVVNMVDVSATLADFFNLNNWPIGRSLIS